MFDVAALGAGLELLLVDLTPWLVVIPGILVGLVFGAIPGLQISTAMAVFLPMTLYMDFMQAMLFLTAIFTGGAFGSSIPAVLMNIPGTASSVATAFDGFPMAQSGQQNTALGIALASSCIGVMIGYSILLLLIMPISQLVLRVGPAEMAVVVFWGITLIGARAGARLLKGTLSGLFGLLVGTIGYGEAGVPRGTFGSVYLTGGVPVVPAMLGLFAASELFRLANRRYVVADDAGRRVSMRATLAGFRLVVAYPLVLVRGCLIGVFVGALPGVGSSIANLLSYVEAKRTQPDPDSFGKGDPAGIVASESANST